MTDENPSADTSGTDANPVSGSMLFYERPQLLANEDHAHLGLRPLDKPFEFARKARAIPVVAGEFVSIQKHCPIVFHGAAAPAPVAVVGIGEDDNLFVEESGDWSIPGYIPAYVRCYPFALAAAAEERYAVVFDRAAPMVSGEPEVPFFQGQEIAPPIQERIDFCRSYEAEKQRTRTLVDTLKRLDLLTSQQATRTVDGQEQVVARYLAVDRTKLQALDPGTVSELFRDGSLAFIIAHLFSLENFSELLRRRELRAAAHGQ